MDNRPEQLPLMDMADVILDNQREILTARKVINDSFLAIKEALRDYGARRLYVPLEINPAQDSKLKIFSHHRIQEGLEGHTDWQPTDANEFAGGQPLTLDSVLGTNGDNLLLLGRNSELRAFYVELTEDLIPLLKLRGEAVTES